MAYLGKTPSQAVRSRYYFTASGGETSLSGTDDNSNTLTFTDGNYVDVSLNGVALVAGSDYNTTTANTIGGLTALTASDVVEVVVYDTFSVFSGNVNSDFSVGGDLTITGTTTTSGNINFGDNDKAIFGAGSDLQIYHDGSNSFIKDAGPGSLQLHVSGLDVLNAAAGEFIIRAAEDGSVDLYHDNSKKLETTSTGIDVTGTVTADGLTVDASGGGLTFSGGGNTFISATSSPLIFQTSSGTERMRITGTGLVGIGTTGPVGKLHVVDGRSYFASNSNAFATYLRYNNSTAGVFVGSPAANEFQISNSGGAARFNIDSSGNVGIGSSSPEALLHVEGASTGQMMFRTSGSSVNKWLIGKNSSADFSIGEDGNEWLYVERDSGNVGIGESSPADKIHSSGDIRLTSGASTTRRVYALAGGGAYSLNSSGGAAIAFHRDASNNDEIAFETHAQGSSHAERMRITRSGNVGIGVVPSGTAKLQVNGQIYASSDGSASAPAFAVNDGDTGMFRVSNNVLGFTTNGGERLRIGSTGYIWFNTTTNFVGQGNTATGQMFQTEGTAYFSRATGYSLGLNRNSDGELTNFSRSGSFKGSININSSSVSYNTTSDHRLKQNVVDMTGAIDRVKALAPKRFNFIADADTTVDGFLAHEAQAVVPEAVTGTHNEVDDDGNPVMQGIDQSKLVPLLTGALREAIAKIEALETSNADLIARIETLENA